LPPGSAGLIEARTPLMVDGYLWNPAATEAAFIDGWYRTSDVGIMPAPGTLIVLGRADNMLNIGGVKVPPEPLEARIRALDGVRDAVLLASPGALGMNELTVVLEAGPSGLPATVRDGLTRILAPVARTFRLRVEPALPRTLTGKVRREAIRA
jgi:acyl-coenzyme A synthetase/AMP-(fatty) acid ligase